MGLARMHVLASGVAVSQRVRVVAVVENRRGNLAVLLLYCCVYERVTGSF